MLGYPADARLLIINADDFGMCHAVNAAIIGALQAGVVRSTSVMVPCAWATHAMRFLADHPAVAFGVHLTAVGDGAVYRWGPVSSREQVPSLIDRTGHFYPFDRMAEYLAGVDLRELEAEFRAQIETVLAGGLRPTHLDWHSLRIADRLDIFEMMFRLAREHGLALRVAYPRWREAMRGRGLPALDHDLLDSYGLDAPTKAARCIRLLRELPAGLSEWAAHPALDTPEMLTIEPAPQRTRQADYDFFTSQAARDAIREEGIILIDYHSLQAAWQSS